MAELEKDYFGFLSSDQRLNEIKKLQPGVWIDSGKDFGKGEPRLNKVKPFLTKLWSSKNRNLKTIIKKCFLSVSKSLNYDKKTQTFLQDAVTNYSIGIYDMKKIIFEKEEVEEMSMEKAEWSNKKSKDIIHAHADLVPEDGETVIKTSTQKNDGAEVTSSTVKLTVENKELNADDVAFLKDIGPKMSGAQKEDYKTQFQDRLTGIMTNVTDPIKGGYIGNQKFKLTNIPFKCSHDKKGIFFDIEREEEGGSLTCTFKTYSYEDDGHVPLHSRIDDITNFENTVGGIFTFVNSLISQCNKKPNGWKANMLTVLTSLKIDHFDKSREKMKGNIKKGLENFKSSYEMLMKFKDVFIDLGRHLGLNDVELLNFVVACLFELKTKGDESYLFDNYLLEGGDKTVVLQTNDGGLGFRAASNVISGKTVNTVYGVFHRPEGKGMADFTTDGTFKYIKAEGLDSVAVVDTGGGKHKNGGGSGQSKTKRSREIMKEVRKEKEEPLKKRKSKDDNIKDELPQIIDEYTKLIKSISDSIDRDTEQQEADQVGEWVVPEHIAATLLTFGNFHLYFKKMLGIQNFKGEEDQIPSMYLREYKINIGTWYSIFEDAVADIIDGKAGAKEEEEEEEVDIDDYDCSVFYDFFNNPGDGEVNENFRNWILMLKPEVIQKLFPDDSSDINIEPYMRLRKDALWTIWSVYEQQHPSSGDDEVAMVSEGEETLTREPTLLTQPQEPERTPRTVRRRTLQEVQIAIDNIKEQLDQAAEENNVPLSDDGDWRRMVKYLTKLYQEDKLLSTPMFLPPLTEETNMELDAPFTPPRGIGGRKRRTKRKTKKKRRTKRKKCKRKKKTRRKKRKRTRKRKRS